jgi:hypothetical protein
MTTYRFAPRVPHVNRDEFATPKRKKPRLGLALVFGVAVVLGYVVWGFASPSWSTRLAMFGIATTLALVFWWVVELFEATTRGRVTILTESTLRFVQTCKLAILPWAVGIVGLTPGFALAVGIANSHAGWDRREQAVAATIASLAVAELGRLLRGATNPRGLEVSAYGLKGVRYGPDVDIPWENVRSVTALRGGSGVKLYITTAHGKAFAVPAWVLGSDPAPVAGIIDHFLDRRKYRPLLDTAWDAIRHVEDTNAPKPFSSKDKGRDE